MHRFSSNEGYTAEDGLVPTLRAFRQQRHPQFDNVVIGVVTNSDDRVPSILSSFGLNVSPLRYGMTNEPATTSEAYDIDFHCMSYDVGVEKPDKKIFNAAELMLARVMTSRSGKTATATELERWQKVYVGDEYAKDVVGSTRAGWNAVLLDVDGKASDITRLEECRPRRLNELFSDHAVVRVGSLRSLAEWMTGTELGGK